MTKAVDGGTALSTFQGTLEDSLSHYRLWQTLAMLADIAYDKADYPRATMRYQEALEAIDDEDLTRTAPDASVIERLFHRAEETRLVATDYVSLPPFRDGRPRALSDPDIRGFKPEQTAWPITFATNSSELTEKGKAALEDLWIQMSYEDFPDITLVGYNRHARQPRRQPASVGAPRPGRRRLPARARLCRPDRHRRPWREPDLHTARPDALFAGRAPVDEPSRGYGALAPPRNTRHNNIWKRTTRRDNAMRTITLLALAIFAIPILMPVPAHAAENCTELRAEIEAAGSTPSSEALKAMHDQALALSDCDDALIEHLLRRIAVAMSREAGATAGAAQQEMLEASLQYHRLWQVLKQLGDIAYEGKDYTGATRRYQDALEAIDDPEATADRHVPDRQVVEEIYRLAELTRMLADEYVAAPVNRNGESTGLAAPSVRGYTFSAVAIPITFVFGQTRFDPQGKAAAQDLLNTLMAQGAPDITLVGHTDPVGSRRYNQGLSERRALVVAQFLRQGGYTGNIATVGRGEEEPYQVPGNAQFNRRELFRLMRRVGVTPLMSVLKHLARSLAVAGLAGGVLATAPAEAAVYGLVVGVNEYRDDRLRDLHGAVNDANDIYEAINAVGAAQVIRLLDTDVTRERVMAAWNELVAKAAPGDTIIFSYAGHGAQQPERVPGTEDDGNDEMSALRLQPRRIGQCGAHPGRRDQRHV